MTTVADLHPMSLPHLRKLLTDLQNDLRIVELNTVVVSHVDDIAKLKNAIDVTRRAISTKELGF